MIQIESGSERKNAVTVFPSLGRSKRKELLHFWYCSQHLKLWVIHSARRRCKLLQVGRFSVSAADREDEVCGFGLIVTVFVFFFLLSSHDPVASALTVKKPRFLSWSASAKQRGRQSLVQTQHLVTVRWHWLLSWCLRSTLPSLWECTLIISAACERHGLPQLNVDHIGLAERRILCSIVLLFPQTSTPFFQSLCSWCS